MKTSLEHLPEGKRQELQHVLEVLLREFDEATKGKSSKRGQGRILKVVLFGSYARTDWVDDPIGGYKSDYDLPKRHSIDPDGCSRMCSPSLSVTLRGLRSAAGAAAWAAPRRMSLESVSGIAVGIAGDFVGIGP